MCQDIPDCQVTPDENQTKLTAGGLHDNDFIGNWVDWEGHRMLAADRITSNGDRAAASASSIFLDKVAKTYGGPAGVRAVAPITVELSTGEAVSIVGPSGCGKSTLMRLIA